MSAVDRVISVPELLLAILGYIDDRSLLLLQGVSRQFRDTIVGTKELRHRLFLQGKSNYAVEPQDIKINPFFAIRIPDRLHRDRDGKPRVDILLHRDFLTPAPRHGEIPYKVGYEAAYPPGSWQRMLLFQPPVELHADIAIGTMNRRNFLAYELIPANATISGILKLRSVRECLNLASMKGTIKYHYSAIKAGHKALTSDGKDNAWLQKLTSSADLPGPQKMLARVHNYGEGPKVIEREGPDGRMQLKNLAKMERDEARTSIAQRADETGVQLRRG